MITYEEAAAYEGKEVVVSMSDGEKFDGHLTEVVFDIDPDEFEEECLLLHRPGYYIELPLSEIAAISVQ